jgi:hypothetical protein
LEKSLFKEDSMRLRTTFAVVVAALLLASAPGRAADAPKGAARVSPDVQARFKAFSGQESQRVLSLENAKRTARTQSLKASFPALRSAAVAKAALDKAGCFANPRIDAVTPDTFQPGDPVLVTGCGFKDAKGMLLLSDGNTQMSVGSWADTSIESVAPDLQGFADPKSVTLKVVTVEAGKSVPSKPLTLQPSLDLKEIVAIAADLQGCTKFLEWGIVHHASDPGASCPKSGTDTVKFARTLQNHWAFHSLSFDTVCPGACGGLNGTQPDKSGFQLGKSVLPDLHVAWWGTMSYYASVRVMGPKGTDY